MKNSRIVYRDYNLLESIQTSHKTGEKRVLLSNTETHSSITQIAITRLFAGERVKKHVHLTMDEHYIVLSGKGSMQLDNETYDFIPGKFILVPAGCYHDLSASSDLEFITIGVDL
ncbi:cupin domain-containing protein [Proteiniphilum acetatigenes]|uniref:cupin domain-containing protein n=1 Tax=Proteiniphilum acetatigenes TaxID=294710 RepID=UPI000376B715|nr:cupin domain-containing protein [Proteiniphilum acetatigenes]SFS36100.1 Cupin domain-containing protein [Porphyromonadaceae bacterium NLAE-zl-C104]